MQELKDLTTLQLVALIQEISAKTFITHGDEEQGRKDIKEIADVLMQKLQVQAFKNVMGVSK